MRGQNPYQRRFSCPQATIVPQRKATGPMPLVYIFKEDFCSFFFVLSMNVRAKSASKEAFVPPKQILCPKRKQHDRRLGDAVAIKTFFLVFIPEYIFLPYQNFLCHLLPSTLLWRRVCILE